MDNLLKSILVREDHNGQCDIWFENSLSGWERLLARPDFGRAARYAHYQANPGMTLRFERSDGHAIELAYGEWGFTTLI
jgi:hypothetical protein